MCKALNDIPAEVLINGGREYGGGLKNWSHESSCPCQFLSKDMLVGVYNHRLTNMRTKLYLLGKKSTHEISGPSVILSNFFRIYIQRCV